LELLVLPALEFSLFQFPFLQEGGRGFSLNFFVFLDRPYCVANFLEKWPIVNSLSIKDHLPFFHCFGGMAFFVGRFFSDLLGFVCVFFFFVFSFFFFSVFFCGFSFLSLCFVSFFFFFFLS